MASPRSALGLAAMGGRLYAVGGSTGGEILRTVERYDPQARRRAPGTTMARNAGGSTRHEVVTLLKTP